MGFDYAKLKGRITEIYGSQSAFAKAMELSERSISLKLNGHVPFSQPEISRALTLLNLDVTQASDYFLRLKFNNLNFKKERGMNESGS